MKLFKFKSGLQLWGYGFDSWFDPDFCLPLNAPKEHPVLDSNENDSNYSKQVVNLENVHSLSRVVSSYSSFSLNLSSYPNFFMPKRCPLSV